MVSLVSIFSPCYCFISRKLDHIERTIMSLSFCFDKKKHITLIFVAGNRITLNLLLNSIHIYLCIVYGWTIEKRYAKFYSFFVFIHMKYEIHTDTQKFPKVKKKEKCGLREKGNRLVIHCQTIWTQLNSLWREYLKSMETQYTTEYYLRVRVRVYIYRERIRRANKFIMFKLNRIWKIKKRNYFPFHSFKPFPHNQLKTCSSAKK